jgi:hypothetical protein
LEKETIMSIKSIVVAAAVAAGTFGLTDRADAQWRTYRYSYPTYTYSYPAYSTYAYPSYYSTYSYPTYYDPGVVVAGYTPSYYSQPYTTYYDPWAMGTYNAYTTGYSNVYGNPYGISVGTTGGMIMGRRAWRW